MKARIADLEARLEMSEAKAQSKQTGELVHATDTVMETRAVHEASESSRCMRIELGYGDERQAATQRTMSGPKLTLTQSVSSISPSPPHDFTADAGGEPYRDHYSAADNFSRRVSRMHNGQQAIEHPPAGNSGAGECPPMQHSSWRCRRIC